MIVAYFALLVAETIMPSKMIIGAKGSLVQSEICFKIWPSARPKKIMRIIKATGSAASSLKTSFSIGNVRFKDYVIIGSIIGDISSTRIGSV